jgi:very-short-patch-repair endonuclease
VVFPSPHLDNARLGVKWRFVKHGVYEERRNFPEAKHIADAVVWHMMTCPEESLGVVTLNGTQRDLVEELLEARFRENGACQAYMDSWESEGWPLFVKNLENVQGDERDCILISTTFGKPTGSTKVRQNFGPISRADGWRRLNVLFTRAKRRVELFTSMQPEDIILDEKTPLGTKALRDYLDFAKRGILTTTEETDRPPDSDFEISVAAALEAKGYEVRPQLGVAGYYLDLAVRNPDRPGEWLAAIECDGATYHSGLSVRDRDRIRQEILEALGWKGRIYRIWSTDWFYNPLQEVGKLTAFLANCMADSKRREREELVAFPWDDDVGNAPASVSESSVHSIVDADTQAIEALRELEAEAPYADRFVEVGDRVTYCFLDNPTAKMTVMIVDSESNPKLNIVNENTPIALGLLGLTPGEDGVLISPSQKERALRVLNIER